jgi:hypothetical protein
VELDAEAASCAATRVKLQIRSCETTEPRKAAKLLKTTVLSSLILHKDYEMNKVKFTTNFMELKPSSEADSCAATQEL